MICGSFLASSWYSPAGVVFVVILVAQGERQKEEVYSLISSLIRRIDRPCESYSPPTNHFFVVAPNPIIVPPHSTFHSSACPLHIRAGLWPFLFLIFLFLFFIFSFPLSFPMKYGYRHIVHLFCFYLSLGYSFNQFKYAATDLTKTVR